MVHQISDLSIAAMVALLVILRLAFFTAKIFLLLILICDWIYGNCFKSHIRSYKIIDFKDFKAL